MYQLMVVDDEPLMRMYLSKSIPTFTDRFSVATVAIDGLDAIEQLKHQPIHVVVTDIKMPEMDGLGLAKYINENYPDTIVAIISGFSDFEYARKAIQYNVFDYLLKPLVDDNLKELLQNIAERLDSSQTASTQNIKISIPVIQRARDYLMIHYSENISLSDTADYCNVSSSYLSDLFHKQLNISYSKYLLNLRMEQAVQLMKLHPEMKVYEIATASGFLTAKYFISVFKKYYGMTPSAYINCLAENS